MTEHEIVALRCPSCGGEATDPSRELPFGAELRCDHCGATSVLIVDRALVPLGTMQRQGEQVCITCGRVARQEARFCQEGHALVKRCRFAGCHREFAVGHQRCDFCGRLEIDAPTLHAVYQGIVGRITEFGAFVELPGGADGLLHMSEIANHRVKDVRDELKEGEQINVKIIRIDGDGKVFLSCKALGRA